MPLASCTLACGCEWTSVCGAWEPGVELQVRVRGSSSVLTCRSGDQGSVDPTAVYHRQRPPTSHPDVQPGLFSSRRGSGSPPWHVHTGCCPGGETHGRTCVEERASALGAIDRLCSCVRERKGEKANSWGGQRNVTLTELNRIL